MRSRSLLRLYELLPNHVRARDHGEGLSLQALMQILARELEVVETDIDALYEDWFIETCEDWAVPYIGDLVGASRLRPFGDEGGSLRAYVANTLDYRRAKGTVAVLEQLARDVTGWPARAVEVYKRLIQTVNVNHRRPELGGTVSLADADAASQTGGPFETAHHLVGVRPIEEQHGRYNIPNVALFAWRLQSLFIPFVFDEKSGYRGAVQPKESAVGAGFYRVDPLGRDLRLFNRARTEPALAHLAREVDLPGPLRRRPLFDDLAALRDGLPDGGAYFVDDAPSLAVRLDGSEVEPGRLFCCNLEDRDDGQSGTTWRRPANTGEVLFDPVLGRLALHTGDAAKSVEIAHAYGAPLDVGGGPYGRQASVDDWFVSFQEAADDGSLWQVGVTARSDQVTDDVNQGGPVVATLGKAIERWNTFAAGGAIGLITIMDSASYPGLTSSLHQIKIPAEAQLAIVAAGWPAQRLAGGAVQRPLGALSPEGRRPHVRSGLSVVGVAQSVETPGGLIVDGLLLEGTVAVAEGDLGRLEVRHTTSGATVQGLGPGLTVATGSNGTNGRLAVLLDHVIAGAVTLGESAARLDLFDSLLGEDKSANPDPSSVPLVLDAKHADLVVGRSTLYGRSKGRTLSADDSIFVGPPTIARRQEGCLRFCYVPAGGRLPRRYRCVPNLQLAEERKRLERKLTESEKAQISARLRPVFTSSSFGDPAFGQLALTCPVEISGGAEHDGEMGAMNSLGNPARVANLRDALDEYLPFGLEAGMIFVT